jgi:large exoprotein involved in heme utilization and adhesion
VCSSDLGRLVLSTGKLVIEDGAALLVGSSRDLVQPGGATGNAGKLQVKADSIYLNGGTITAATLGNDGGNITLQTQSLIMRNQSQITATADTGSKGGNITINAGVIGAVPIENSNITANAPQGAGGRIIINSQGIFGLQVSPILTPKSDITAFGKTAELSGIIQVNTPDVNVQGALNQLNGNFVNTEQAIANSCFARRNAQQGSFTVTGTSGLPTTPYEALSSRYTVTQVQGLSSGGDGETRGQGRELVQNVGEQSSSAPTWKPDDSIVEAQGLTLTPDGRIIAGTTPQLLAARQAKDIICSFRTPEINTQ